ncbi:MAG: SagB/ThcOx family dehydrogenase [Deltaproteobacteria bacterium]|nr:SagB/ThcOx family dehydrogenase [Deltaproteobacteria bacterium]
MAGTVTLPQPSFKGRFSVEEALKERRTVRSFKDRPLSLEELAQVLWAAQGTTAQKHGYHLKTAPSAGALYPLDVYAVVGQKGVDGLSPGVFRYLAQSHALEPIKEGDQRQAVARASLSQMWMAKAPLMLVITGEYARCTVKYGRRGVTYTQIEAGCVGQNVFLQAEALGLKAGIVGAFRDEEVTRAVGNPAKHEPLLIMPVGQGK